MQLCDLTRFRNARSRVGSGKRESRNKSTRGERGLEEAKKIECHSCLCIVTCVYNLASCLYFCVAFIDSHSNKNHKAKRRQVVLESRFMTIKFIFTRKRKVHTCAYGHADEDAIESSCL